jgi:hypothetical protein
MPSILKTVEMNNAILNCGEILKWLDVSRDAFDVVQQ